MRLTVLGACVVALFAPAGCDGEKSSVNAPAHTEAQSKRTQVVAEMRSLIQAGKGIEAFALGTQNRRLNDPDIEKLIQQASKLMGKQREQQLLAQVKQAKPTDHQTLLTYYAQLEKIDPSNKKYVDAWRKHRTALDREIEANTKKARALDRARRKQQGVSVGMTKEEVLMSSWGKPERINQTTTSRGTREQWVYGSRNYLYFTEDGRLSTIQN